MVSGRGTPGKAFEFTRCTLASSCQRKSRERHACSTHACSTQARSRSTLTNNCRHDSLDSLQHLSGDGFLRSWLPSYANFAKVRA